MNTLIHQGSAGSEKQQGLGIEQGRQECQKMHRRNL